MRRILTADLFLPLQTELVALLRSLDDSDWLRPTVAPGWAVKDVAAHLLDTDLRRLSSHRDGYRPRSPAGEFSDYDGLVSFLNDLNATWVGAAERLSPRVIVGLLEWCGPQVADLFTSLAPDDPAPISVAWAGEQRSANWMDVGREYTEKWHHQAQIRDAVGAAPLDGRRWLAPVLALSMYALPYAFRDVAANEGDALVVNIEGEAGGVWHVVRRGGAWELGEGEAAGAPARVRLDADTAWRLFFNALGREEAGRRVAAEGDAKLCGLFLGVRSVMV
ncbi:MAG TPA: maleylpyruvate isomerase N-terminal domain-containing protein [Pyrinomonadaceae bacterium]|nr:maleylpyruvate isomerase N-terminal domain-containing protein [Pyrinomonadaceae bacterium]